MSTFHLPTITRRDPARPMEHEDQLRKTEILEQRNDRIRRWIQAYRLMPTQSNAVHTIHNNDYAKDGIQPFVTVDDVHDLLRETASDTIRRACGRIEREAFSLESAITEAVAQVNQLRDELDPNMDSERPRDEVYQQREEMLKTLERLHDEEGHAGAFTFCDNVWCRRIAEAADER